MNIFVFTTGLSSWNIVILNSLLEDRGVTIKGICFSEPQAGYLGFKRKLNRLLSYGVDNLARIAFQKFIRSNIDSLEQKKYQERMKDIPKYSTSDFKDCLKLAKESSYISLLVYFNRIIPKKYIPELNIINIHPSSLPYYRGVQPVFWALLNNEKEIGITIHKVDEGIDTGAIYKQIKFPITSKSINANMNMVSREISKVLPDIIDGIANNKIIPIKQNKEIGNYFSRPTSSDIRLFFNQGNKYY